VLCTDDEITPRDLSFPFRYRMKQSGGDTLEEVEKSHIARILDRVEWNVSKAASVLDIDRSTLYSKIRKYDLSKTS
jgi:transcriptional regulator of acetoin/glycerol metabolism